MLVVELARPGPPIVLDGIEAERVEGPRQWLRLPRTANAAAVVAALARDHEVRDISLREAASRRCWRGSTAATTRTGARGARWPRSAA